MSDYQHMPVHEAVESFWDEFTLSDPNDYTNAGRKSRCTMPDAKDDGLLVDRTVHNDRLTVRFSPKHSATNKLRDTLKVAVAERYDVPPDAVLVHFVSGDENGIEVEATING